MKHFSAIAVLVVLLFAQCKKEEPLKVTYSVREDSMEQPSYSITYTSDKIGSSTIASSSGDYWNSDPVFLDRGQFVSLKVNCTSPVFDLVLRVYVNGFLWQEKAMHNPTASATISGNLGE
jgi:hypothetical protein